MEPGSPARRPAPLPLWAQIASGSTAACLSVVFTNVPEVVKTRLQLDGEGAKHGVQRQYKGVVDAFIRIGRQEGLRGLQAGLGAAFLHQSMMNGARLGCYEPIQNALVEAGATPGSTLTRIAAGALSGGLGATLGSPAYLVKSRLQSQSPFFVAAERHSYTGTFDGLRKIAAAEGIRGLFRGIDGALPRVMTGSAVQLTSYDLCKVCVQLLPRPCLDLPTPWLSGAGTYHGPGPRPPGRHLAALPRGSRVLSHHGNNYQPARRHLDAPLPERRPRDDLHRAHRLPAPDRPQRGMGGAHEGLAAAVPTTG